MASRTDLDRLVGDLGARSDQQVVDSYFFLVRVGTNWTEYRFKWEPFRDLAGPPSIDPPSGALPIVIRSVDKAGSPTIVESDDVVPHVEITVAPMVPLTAIVETWIATLSSQGVAFAQPQGWFLDNLGIRPDDVSLEVRRFLGLGPVEAPASASASASGRAVDIGVSASGPAADGAGGSAPDLAAQGPAVSPAVQAIADELGPSDITAFDIARALAARHPQYAGGGLAALHLEPPRDAPSRRWQSWVDQVVALYDPADVARSTHRVVDGRLFLVGLCLLDSSLRTVLDAGGSWEPLLLEVDDAVASPGSRLSDVLGRVTLAHGYRSDRAFGEDQLDITGEVNAVCDVITDPDVQPPLAVGLFGEWGTGKSFFMEQMRRRIEALTAGGDPSRVSNVVQIRFNAWHYADTSLWASLAVETFERLVDPEPVDVAAFEQWLVSHGDEKREERAQLLRELETYRAAKAATDVERGQLERAKDEAEQRLAAATAARRGSVERFAPLNVARRMAADQEVSDAIERVADDLGFAPAVSELRGLALELHTTAGFVPMVWRQVRHKSWALGLAATFAVLALATLGLTLRVGQGWLAPLVTAVGSVASLVVGAARFVRPAARQVNSGLAAIETAIGTASKVEADLLAEHGKQERSFELDLAEIDQRIDEATRTVAALDERIAATAAAADALTVGHRLYEFLTDRAAGYQRHQGVIGMLHRDFRFLDAQLRAYRRQADRNPKLPAVDRVVLYVDDLDRCPPAKVLEVLEAVHLLMALELFVVVVGVDPRWLQRSLRHQYRKLVTDGDRRTDPYLRTMPIEYLEKIFQIPLTLAKMTPAAYARLVASLAPSVAVAPAVTVEASGAGAGTTTRRAPTEESPGGDRTPTRAPLGVEPGSSAGGTAGRSIDLTPAEVAFAQGLGSLVDTPRAAKRLMNTYRLIRATRHVGSRSRFLGSDGEPGEYQAVLTLLAVSAAYPSMVDRLLVALEVDAGAMHIGSWRGFVEALDPAAHDGSPGSPGGLVPPEIAAAPGGSEAVAWANMVDGVRASLRPDQLDDLATFRRWGPVVARFSFTL